MSTVTSTRPAVQPIEREALLEALLDVFTEDLTQYQRLIARWQDAEAHANDPSPTFRGESDAVKRAWQARYDVEAFARAHPDTMRLALALGIKEAE